MVIRDPDAAAADGGFADEDRPTTRQPSVFDRRLEEPPTTEFTGTGTGTATRAAATGVTSRGPSEELTSHSGGRLGTLIARRYELLELLGKGGMGLVYRARDHELDEEVAIKLLQHEYTQELSEIERLKREIVTARKITHPNVIRIHEFGMDGESGDAFISMEVLPGGSLEEEIRRGLIPLNRAINIAIGICEGLGSAHEQGIIHRDIKPENVLFAADGRPKLLDFGLARSAGSTNHTVWGVTGTPRYMSPEQTLGGEATPRTDVYSMGVLLFQLFTGQFPFDGKNIEELATKHAEQPPPKPRSLRKELPARLEGIILKALEKDPAKRFRNANELASELRALKESSNPQAMAAPRAEPAANGRAQDPTLLIRSDLAGPPSAGEATVIGPSNVEPPTRRDLLRPPPREPGNPGARAPAEPRREPSLPGGRTPGAPRREPSQPGRVPRDPRREPSAGRIATELDDFSGRPTLPPVRPGDPAAPGDRAGSKMGRLVLYGGATVALIVLVGLAYLLGHRLG